MSLRPFTAGSSDPVVDVGKEAPRSFFSRSIVTVGALYPRLLPFQIEGLSRQHGLSHHLSRVSWEMSGARGAITAFARALVSEPCRALGASLPLHLDLGCRLSVPGVSGSSPDFQPALARRRAMVSLISELPSLGTLPPEELLVDGVRVGLEVSLPRLRELHAFEVLADDQPIEIRHRRVGVDVLHERWPYPFEPE
jgi:hypothetical protein